MNKVTFDYRVVGIGTPDYSQAKPTGQVPVGTISTVTDVGEQAARQGSVVTYDRRGNVFWLDDFENGVNKWTVAGVGASAALLWTDEESRMQRCAGKIVVGPAADSITHITHRMQLLSPVKLGFEISFTWNTGFSSIVAYVSYARRNIIYDARVRYNKATETLQYLDSGWVWRNIAQILDLAPIATFDTLFHTVKIVADFSTHKYERCIFGSTEYDLSSYDLPTIVPGIAQSEHCGVDFQVWNDEAADNIGYVDDAIVTQNEPANVEVS